MRKIKQIILRIIYEVQVYLYFKKNLSKERFINWRKARKGNRLYALVDAMAIVSQGIESAMKTQPIPPSYVAGGIVKCNSRPIVGESIPESIVTIENISPIKAGIIIDGLKNITIQPDPCPKNKYNKVLAE